MGRGELSPWTQVMGRVPLPPPPCRVPNPLEPQRSVVSRASGLQPPPFAFQFPPPSAPCTPAVSGSGVQPRPVWAGQKNSSVRHNSKPLAAPCQSHQPSRREGGASRQAPPPETQNGVLVWWGRWPFTQGAQREKGEGLQFPTSLSAFGACSPVLSSNPEWPGRCPLPLW